MWKRYRPFYKAAQMDLLAFKGAIFTWLLVSSFQVACTLFLWFAVYHSSTSEIIQGFTMKDMIVYQVFINIFSFVTFDGTTAGTIHDEIKDGSIAMSFIKPISYRVRFIFSNLGAFSMLALLFGLPCFTISYLVFYLVGYIEVTSIWAFLWHVALFLIAQVLATMLNDAVNYIFGVLCFYTMASFGLEQIKGVIISFLSGTLLPLSFFPGVWSTILNASPFAGMAQNPILILLGKMDFLTALTKIGLSIIWILVLEMLGALLFKRASKKITVQGG